MDIPNSSKSRSFFLLDDTSERVRKYFEEVFDTDRGILGHTNPWTQRQIIKDNLGKVALVQADEEPAEACYRDLIREIDTEARMGIYLAGEGAQFDHLRRAVCEPGVSGQLSRDIARIAPIYFADELARSDDAMNLVWVAIRAAHDRASVDARVSEITLSYLTNDAQGVNDRLRGMRALQYSFHEDVVRNRVGLPLLLTESEIRDLRTRVGELAVRCGSYDERVAEIGRRAEAIPRLPRI